MELDTKHFKDLLEKEVGILENELGAIGRKNPSNPADWEATETPADEESAEDGDVAENIEQYEYNSAELEQLEIQLKDVKNALVKIENGTYGVCEVGGEQIEPDRLEANPSAKTCKKHMNS